MTQSANATEPQIASDQAHSLQCMEIWGGTAAADEALAVHGVDVWVYSQPYQAHQNGGDVHYLSMCGAGHVVRFLVADVAGHGDQVAEVSDRLRKLMRRHINTPNQMKFVRAMGDEFVGQNAEGQFATALVATYFAPTKQLIVVNAGHPPALWYHAETQQWAWLRENEDHLQPTQDKRLANLPLGIIPGTRYAQFLRDLKPGDIVIFYTDSAIEAKNPQGVQLGMEGLFDLAGQLDTTRPQTLHRQLADGLYEYRQGQAPDDDLTLMVVHHNGTQPPAPSMGEKLKVMAKMFGLIKV